MDDGLVQLQQFKVGPLAAIEKKYIPAMLFEVQQKFDKKAIKLSN